MLSAGSFSDLIIGHIPRELSNLSVWRFLWSRHRGRATCVTGEIFRDSIDNRAIIYGDSNGLGVSYRFVEMIMTVPHGPGLK